MPEALLIPRSAGGSDSERADRCSTLMGVGDAMIAATTPTAVQALLQRVAVEGCRLLGAGRSVIYVHDATRKLYVCAMAYPSEETAGVGRLVMGGPTDTVTQDLLATRAAIMIRDAAADPRTARSAAVRMHRTRSMLAVPMLAGDDMPGLLLYDSTSAPLECSEEDIRLVEFLGRLGGRALADLRTAQERAAHLESATAGNRLFRQSAEIEERIRSAIVDGGGLPSIADVVARALKKPVAIYDAEHRRLADVTPEEAAGLPVRLLERRDDAIVEVLRAIKPGTAAVIDAALDIGIQHRHLAAPIDLPEQRAGWLIILEHPSRLGPLDRLAAARAAALAALELATARRARSAAGDSRSWLARQLARGNHAAKDVVRAAHELGVALDTPRVVVTVGSRSGQPGTIDVERLAADLADAADTRVLTTGGRHGAALLVDIAAPDQATAAVRDLRAAVVTACAGHEHPEDLAAGISTLCRRAADVPRGLREANEVTGCVARFTGDDVRVLSAYDLGAGRLFVGNSDTEALDRLVHDVLGPLLGGGDDAATLLATAQAFCDAGHSVRLAALALDVHENTVRKRLARIQVLTDLDLIGDAGDQMTAQTALLVLRLRGHEALPRFTAA